MQDSGLTLFWIAVTSMFIFAGAYAWLMAIIVRKALPGELAWVFCSLAFVTGSNAFIRSGQTIFDIEHIIILSRTLFAVASVTAIVSVIMLAVSYNGTLRSGMSVREQTRILSRAIRGIGRKHESA